LLGKRGNQKFFDVFGKEFREEKRKNLPRKVLQNAQNRLFWSEVGSAGIYRLCFTLQLLAAI